jgi:hypothetical protein
MDEYVKVSNKQAQSIIITSLEDRGIFIIENNDTFHLYIMHPLSNLEERLIYDILDGDEEEDEWEL